MVLEFLYLPYEKRESSQLLGCSLSLSAQRQEVNLVVVLFPAQQPGPSVVGTTTQNSFPVNEQEP